MNLLKINVVDVLQTLVMFGVLLGFGSVVSIFYPMLVDLFVISTSLTLMIIGRWKVNIKMLKALFIVIFIAILSMFFTSSSLVDYKGIFLRSVVVVLIITAFKNNYSNIVRYLIRAIWIVIILALVNLFLIHIIPDFFVFKVASTRYSVHTLGMLFNWNSSSEILGIHFLRNQSIFWEPGVLQILVNVLLYYILLERRVGFSKIIIPTIVLLSTGSTTGMIIFFFLLLIRFLEKSSVKHRIKRKIFTIVALFLFVPVLYGEIVSKFIGDHKISSSLRIYDLAVGAKVILSHPWVGLGMNEDRYLGQLELGIESNGIEIVEERGNTNTLLALMIRFGIPIGCTLLILLYKQKLFIRKKSFFMLMVLSLASEPLLTVYLVILLMFSSVSIFNEYKYLNNKTLCS